jgi:hypothetical protein
MTVIATFWTGRRRRSDYGEHMQGVAMLVTAVAALLAAIQPVERALVNERVRTITRQSAWTEVARVAMTFPTFHPQGMVRIGDTLFVSSVEVKVPATRYATPKDGYDRDTGEGVGHLFKIDLRPGHAGTLIASATLGDGAIYHPGGIDFDGASLWVPVAEYRPDSRSLIYKVDPQTLKATLVLRVADHIGGLVRDTDAGALHGVSWGSRRFYRWAASGDGTIDAATASVRLNPSHYVDYQDCKYAGRGAMLCGGIGGTLGGLDLVDLGDGRPLHQVPVSLLTPGGLPMTRNPVWLEPAGDGLRAYFMPEDDTSVLYVYEVGKNSAAAR